MSDYGSELLDFVEFFGLDVKDDGLLYEPGTETPISGKKVVRNKVSKFFGLIKKNNMMAEFSFKNGKLHGVTKVWHKNGKKWMENEYFKGKPHGWHKKWRKNGELEEEIFFKMGNVEEMVVPPDSEFLNDLVVLYNYENNRLGINKVVITDKEVIEAFVLNYRNLIIERKKRASTEEEKMGLRSIIITLDNYKKDIIEYICNNV